MSSKRIRTSKDEGSSLRGKTVDIAVGVQKEIFSVHETLIRASSSFFDKAMAGDWKESQQRTIQLPEDEPGIFALYVKWLYCGTLPVVCDEPGLPGNSEYINLVKAYVLGDKILDSKFQDTVIDAIVEKSQSKAKDGQCWYPNMGVIKYTFKNTSESAPIRKLLVDMYAGFARSSWIHTWAADLPQPFLFQLASTLLDRRRGTTAPLVANRYHTRRSDDGSTPKNPTSTKK
ncbi:hypothetical protein CNMCM5793_000894 [Aspergillus hiratsukae]|uniref:BTB domain-containing protein n=1 Tax=Aspergillus hiratsukae TaxID=1194566 RepID=A0A8H6PAD8_9EURO|nr:hypothetical protein CNMCM5793_000894 [Aspergillus hiratsukae]